MGYDARRREMIDLLGTKGYDQATLDEYTKVLGNYISQRDGRLENLLELLEPSDNAIHQSWLDKCKEGAAAAQDTISRDQKSLWLAEVSNQEHTFWFKLMTSQVPVKRDLMVQQTKALQKAEKEFEEKWKAIKDADNQIEDRMKKTALEYDEILSSAAKIAAATEKEVKERAVDTFKKVLTLGLGGVDLGIIEYGLKGAASALGIKISEVESRKLEIHALLSREEGVFGTFKEARQMVKEFLEETSYPRIKDAWDGAEAAASGLSSEMLTSGQKDDANAFGSAVRNEVKKVFAKAEDAYKEFARKHENLFFGPLGSTYYQELMEEDFWKERSSRWKQSKYDIDDLLRERTLEASEDKILEVSLSGMTEEDKRLVYERLKSHCQELLKVWNKFKEITNEPEWALESRETLKGVLDALR